jgi:hypothetical protein
LSLWLQREFEKENTVVGLQWSVGWLNSVKHIETPLDKNFIEFITFEEWASSRHENQLCLLESE